MLTFFFIFVIPVLQYFRCVYIQKIAQHNNTKTSTTNKSVGTAFVISIESVANHYLIITIGDKNNVSKYYQKIK